MFKHFLVLIFITSSVRSETSRAAELKPPVTAYGVPDLELTKKLDERTPAESYELKKSSIISPAEIKDAPLAPELLLPKSILKKVEETPLLLPSFKNVLFAYKTIIEEPSELDPRFKPNYEDISIPIKEYIPPEPFDEKDLLVKTKDVKLPLVESLEKTPLPEKDTLSLEKVRKELLKSFSYSFSIPIFPEDTLIPLEERLKTKDLEVTKLTDIISPRKTKELLEKDSIETIPKFEKSSEIEKLSAPLPKKEFTSIPETILKAEELEKLKDFMLGKDIKKDTFILEKLKESQKKIELENIEKRPVISKQAITKSISVSYKKPEDFHPFLINYPDIPIRSELLPLLPPEIRVLGKPIDYDFPPFAIDSEISLPTLTNTALIKDEKEPKLDISKIDLKIEKLIKSNNPYKLEIPMDRDLKKENNKEKKEPIDYEFPPLAISSKIALPTLQKSALIRDEKEAKMELKTEKLMNNPYKFETPMDRVLKKEDNKEKKEPYVLPKPLVKEGSLLEKKKLASLDLPDKDDRPDAIRDAEFLRQAEEKFLSEKADEKFKFPLTEFEFPKFEDFPFKEFEGAKTDKYYNFPSPFPFPRK